MPNNGSIENQKWIRELGRNARYCIFLFILIWLGTAGCKQKIKSALPMSMLTIHQRSIAVELANNNAARMKGLMFRRSLPQDQGMFFVFPDNAVRNFWMKNTQIPLSIAFIDDQGKIENILEMPPYTEARFFSRGPAKYALEMNTGWFNLNGVKAGDLVEGVKNLPLAGD